MTAVVSNKNKRSSQASRVDETTAPDDVAADPEPPTLSCPIPTVYEGHSSGLEKLIRYAEETQDEVRAPVPLAHVDGFQSRVKAPTSIRILAILAIATVLVLGQTVLMPITLGFLMALTLRPLVRRCRKYGLPDAVSALVIMTLMIVAFIAGLTRIVEPAQHWIESIPKELQRVEEKLSSFRDHWAKLTETSAKVQEIAENASGETVVPVEMHESFVQKHLSIMASTGNFLGTTLVVLVLCFFVLTSGDQLLNQILGGLTRLSEKKRTVELVHDIERGIATYLSTVTMINAGLGIATAAGFWLLGVPNPGLWGTMAFVFNYVPFFGPMVCTLIITLVSLLSFDSVIYALVPPIYFIAISAVEGNILTPMIIGKSMSLNPIIVFVALIVGGWAWGLGGAILAVPLLAVGKIVCDKFESTQPFARLLAG